MINGTIAIGALYQQLGVDQRHSERGAIADLQRTLVALGVFIRFGKHVCDVNGSPVEDDTPYNEPARKRNRELADRGAHERVAGTAHGAPRGADHRLPAEKIAASFALHAVAVCRTPRTRDDLIKLSAPALRAAHLDQFPAVRWLLPTCKPWVQIRPS